MSEKPKRKLKIKTAPAEEADSGFVFSPEEMLPFEVAEALESDLVAGKTEKQVKKAKRRFGANELRSDFHLSFRESLKNQLKGMIGVFLALSSLVMFAFHPDEPTYVCMAAVITAIMFFNAFMELRASRALKTPKKYSSLKAKVIRDGEETTIDSLNLIPGDLINVESGMMVPADCRLVDDFGLAVLETHVSGKEGSVTKDSTYIADGPEPVCGNMIYAGSIVTSGHASAIVCRTGEETMMRKMHPAREDYIPGLLKYVISLCRFTSAASAVICLVLLFIGIAAGADITKWFICALAIGASSLCDGMVSLCASSLGFGAKKMANDGMVIKNYGSIQTLAAVNTVMCGRNIAFPPRRIALTGLYFSGRNYDREKRPDDQATELLKLMLVCSEAKRTTGAERKLKRGLPEYKGSPIENAIIDYFEEWNKTVGMIRDQYIRMDAEYSGSGDITRMLALHNGKNTIIVRGAPENVISRCVGYTLDGSDYKLSDFTRKKILAAAADASRTNSFLIAVACGETEEDSLRGIDAEQNLIFKGFVSFSSSLDPGIAESVYKLDGAGIETVLSSSDAYYPAYNAAKSAGIITDESQILTAEQYRSCDEGLLIANSPYYRLFLNLDEDEWLNVLKMRRDGGRITAVTAERINELPLMREADISIVPEESVDTLCQTADMILLGSGMSRIADGILNTKTICRRIRSVVSYLAVGIVMLFTASALSAFYNQIPAFRAQDVMFGGIIFNLAIAFALAYAPRSIRTLKEPFERIGEKPKLTDFIYPLMYAIGGGLVLFVCFAITGKYTCSLIALTLLQFLFACTAADHGGVIASKRFGNSLLYLVGIGIAAVLAFLMFTKPGHRWFTYGVPQASYITLTLIACLVYSVIVQVLRYFLSPHTAKLHKKKKKDELTVPEDEESPEAEEDAEDGAEDEEEPDEDFDEEEPVEEETEKEDEE